MYPWVDAPPTTSRGVGVIEQQIVRVNDIDVNMYLAGEGSPVVLLHGMAETAWSCWSGQIEALANHYKVYAVDLRGHGRTGIGAADGTLEQLGDDLNSFVAEVSGPAAVVGFSMGATIALYAAGQSGSQVSRVVAMGGSSIVGRSTAEFFLAKVRTVLARDVPELNRQIRKEIEGMFVVSPEKAEDYALWRIAAVGEGYGYANAAAAMARMREVPMQPELAKVTVPVDVVGGEKDVWCPKKAADVIIEGLTSAPVRYSEVPGVGHLMSVDDPAAVTRSLLGLLASVPSDETPAARA
jgi:pimeloyl-ACP methyl ester carboxylesterase